MTKLRVRVHRLPRPVKRVLRPALVPPRCSRRDSEVCASRSNVGRRVREVTSRVPQVTTCLGRCCSRAGDCSPVQRGRLRERACVRVAARQTARCAPCLQRLSEGAGGDLPRVHITPCVAVLQLTRADHRVSLAKAACMALLDSIPSNSFKAGLNGGWSRKLWQCVWTTCSMCFHIALRFSALGLIQICGLVPVRR